MRIINREMLMTVESVKDHLYRFRDDLSRCVLGFSGGKDSVALARLVHEIRDDVPLVYASCPGCEWPMHETFVKEWSADILDTSHNWTWFSSNIWAFLYDDSRTAERWARRHHRGHLRRYAKSRGLILLWGNRTKDGNTVPAVRYAASRDETELWMPLRDLSDMDTNMVCGPKQSPIYRVASVGGTGYLTGRVRGSVAARHADVLKTIGRTIEFAKFDSLYRRKFGAVTEQPPQA